MGVPREGIDRRTMLEGAALAAAASALPARAVGHAKPHAQGLWYRQPANAWTEALRFAAAVRFLSQDGRVAAANGGLRVRGASAVTLLIAVATSYRRFDDLTGDPAAIVAAQSPGRPPSRSRGSPPIRPPSTTACFTV